MDADITPDPETLQHWLQQGALTETGQAISALLAQNPGHAQAWLLRGQLKVRQQQTGEALAAFEYALCLQPDLHAAHAGLAEICRAAGQLTLALKHLTAARAFAPEDSPAQRQYTQALLEVSLDSGELSTASLYLKHLLQLAPEAAESYWLCGRVMAALGQNPAAEAAFLQSLHLKPHQPSAQLDLADFYLHHRAWLQAGQVLQQTQAFSLTPQQHARWLSLQGCCDFWQGELPTAREHWRQALAQDFSPQTLAHLCLGLPLVSQSMLAWQQWLPLLHEGLDLLQQQAIAPAAEHIPWDQVPTPWLSHARQVLGPWLEKQHPALERSARTADTPYRLGIVVDRLLRPGLPESLKVLLETLPETQEACVFYLEATALPELLRPWQAQFQPLPQLAPALIQQLAEARLDVLAYWDLSPPLYAAALARPASLQVLLPEATACTSGLERMDLVLSTTAEAAYWEQKPETALCLRDLRFPLLDLPEAETKEPSHNPRQIRQLRQSLGLPRLRRVYGLLAEPRHWLPESDALLKALLENDHQALLIGLQMQGSALHTHLQQRHAETLGAPAGRVRWLPAHTPQSELISVLDGLIALPWAAEGWQIQQALQAGIPVLSWQNDGPQPAANWLQACGLPVAESPAALLNTIALANSDQPPPRHVMLKAHEMAQAIHNMIYREWLQRTGL